MTYREEVLSDYLFKIGRAGAADLGRLADRLQRTAASRLPRASAAVDLHAEEN